MDSYRALRQLIKLQKMLLIFINIFSKKKKEQTDVLIDYYKKKKIEKTLKLKLCPSQKTLSNQRKTA